VFTLWVILMLCYKCLEWFVLVMMCLERFDVVKICLEWFCFWDNDDWWVFWWYAHVFIESHSMCICNDDIPWVVLLMTILCLEWSLWWYALSGLVMIWYRHAYARWGCISRIHTCLAVTFLMVVAYCVAHWCFYWVFVYCCCCCELVFSLSS
jgi:hypothetical protein